MTYNEITDLLDRGFTPDQITQLSISSENPTHSEDPEPVAENSDPLDVSEAGSVIEPPSPEVATAEATIPAEDNNKEVLSAIADLKKALQATNIHTMSVETINPDAELESAMSELIRPSFKKGE